MKLKNIIRIVLKEEQTNTLYRDLFHLVRTGHISYKDGQWFNTGRYSRGGVNASGGLYYKDSTANKSIDIANKEKITPQFVYRKGVSNILRRSGSHSKARPLTYTQWFNAQE